MIGPNGAGKTRRSNVGYRIPGSNPWRRELSRDGPQRVKPHQIADLGLIRTFSEQRVSERHFMKSAGRAACRQGEGCSRPFWACRSPSVGAAFARPARRRSMGWLEPPRPRSCGIAIYGAQRLSRAWGWPGRRAVAAAARRAVRHERLGKNAHLRASWFATSGSRGHHHARRARHGRW